MDELVTQHLQPPTVVIQASPLRESALALVKLQECGLVVHLPAMVCCYYVHKEGTGGGGGGGGGGVGRMGTRPPWQQICILHQPLCKPVAARGVMRVTYVYLETSVDAGCVIARVNNSKSVQLP